MQTEKTIFNRLDILVSLYVAIFCLAPFLSNRIVIVFGAKLLVGSIMMIFSYGLLDIINDSYGLPKARQTVLTAGVVRLIIWGAIALSFLLPTFKEPLNFGLMMQSSFRILISGEIALVVSQYFVDAPVFAWLKQKMSYGFWIRYNFSNIISQTIATSIFISLAFIGTGKPVMALIISQVILRLTISVVLTPIFMSIRHWMKNDRITVEENC